MSAEENKAVVRRYYEEFWNKGDVALVEKCFAREVLLDGKYVDWDNWRDGLTRWLRGFPDIHHHVDLSGGNTSAVQEARS